MILFIQVIFNTLNAAKKLGDVLVVVVATDKTAVKMKKREPLHNAQLRQELVSSLSWLIYVLLEMKKIFSRR